MNIKTKFNIGQTVYYLRYNQRLRHVPCDQCSGQGKVRLMHGDIVTCKRCDGKKTRFSEYVAYAVVEKDKIVNLHASVGRNNSWISYNLNRSGRKEENMLFATRAAAKKACEKSNKS